MRYMLLLVAILLACAGIRLPSDSQMYYGVQQQGQEAAAKASLSGGELLKFPYLARAEEHLGVLRHLPTPPFQPQPNGLILNSSAFELRIQRLMAQYLSQARFLHRSLTIRDIIFPFHYFW